MAKHIPDNHSPLLALGKKVLLWGLLPAGLIFTAFYVVDSFESPGRQSVRRAVEELSKERVEKLSHSPTVKSANELKASLAAKDDATNLQERIRKILELSGSKLEGEELRKVQEMTPAQLAEYEQKKLDGLMELKKPHSLYGSKRKHKENWPLLQWQPLQQLPVLTPMITLSRAGIPD